MTHEIKKEKQTILRVKEPASLVAFLTIHFSGKSNTALKSMLSHKRVCVNGEVVTHYNHLLQSGDIVACNTGKVETEFVHSKVKIVFEDDYLIVIDKAEGLLAVPTDEHREELTAFYILLDYLKKKDRNNRLFVVHRIDRETSGLLMFAKHNEVRNWLQNNWHENVKERVYVAVVEGVPDKEEDTIISNLRESKVYKMHSSSINKAGKRAITYYRLLRKNEYYSMLRVELETGRKNQIRVHLQNIGHPIIGDRKYGAGISPIGRLGLHATVLAFEHPITHEVLRFETQIPKKFTTLFSEK